MLRFDAAVVPLFFTTIFVNIIFCDNSMGFMLIGFLCPLFFVCDGCGGWGPYLLLFRLVPISLFLYWLL